MHYYFMYLSYLLHDFSLIFMRGTGFYRDSLVVPLKGLNFGITVDFFGKLVLILPKLFDRIYQ